MVALLQHYFGSEAIYQTTVNLVNLVNRQPRKRRV